MKIRDFSIFKRPSHKHYQSHYARVRVKVSRVRVKFVRRGNFGKFSRALLGVTLAWVILQVKGLGLCRVSPLQALPYIALTFFKGPLKFLRGSKA